LPSNLFYVKAMLFAAGLGTRLRPLTDTQPKALVEVNGRPLLAWNLWRLRKFGYTDVVINVHHFADQIIDYLQREERAFLGMKIKVSDEREMLLDTGGGLKKAMRLLLPEAYPILLCNADVLCTIDLNAMRRMHQRWGGVATLAVQNRPSSRQLLFDEDYKLCGWQNLETNERLMARQCPDDELTAFAFSGIQLVQPPLIKHIPLEGRFSLIDLYLHLAADNDIYAYEHESEWLDVGTPDQLPKAAEMTQLLLR